jgi:hypothetical protein
MPQLAPVALVRWAFSLSPASPFRATNLRLRPRISRATAQRRSPTVLPSDAYRRLSVAAVTCPGPSRERRQTAERSGVSLCTRRVKPPRIRPPRNPP